MMDWRQQIARNQKRTFYVLCSFFALYFMMGWLVVALLSPHEYFLHIDQLKILENQYIISGFMLVSLIFILISVFFGARLSVLGTQAKQIKSNTTAYKQLYNIVEEMQIAAGLRFMPKVYVLDVDYHNAFASGWQEKNAIIAVSQPLLELLNREELQAVVAHEMSHIKHQDIRVMTLIMVASNILVMLVDIFARNILYTSRQKNRSKKDKNGGVLIIALLILRIVLPIVTACLVAYTSRQREFLADAGCVKITRNNKALGNALVKIHTAHAEKTNHQSYQNTPHESFRSLAYIYAPSERGFFNYLDLNSWFSTHPKLKDRLKALRLS